MRDIQRVLFLTMIWIIVTFANKLHQAVPSLAGTTITNYYKFLQFYNFGGCLFYPKVIDRGLFRLRCSVHQEIIYIEGPCILKLKLLSFYQMKSMPKSLLVFKFAVVEKRCSANKDS